MQLIKKLFKGAVSAMPLSRAVSSAMMVEKIQECLFVALTITAEQARVVSIKQGILTIATANSTYSMIINMKKENFLQTLAEQAPEIKISRIRFLLGLTQ